MTRESNDPRGPRSATPHAAQMVSEAVTCVARLALSRCESPRDWLAVLASAVASLERGTLAGQAAIVGVPASPQNHASRPRVEHVAVAGAPSHNAAQTLVLEALRDWPHDDSFARFAASVARAPRAAARIALHGDDTWRAHPMGSLLRGAGLHDFARAWVLVVDEPQCALIIEAHGRRGDWVPTEALLWALAALAGVAATEYQRRFVLPVFRKAELAKQLTPRQREFLPHLIGQRSQRQIGLVMGCSAHTVNEHCRSIQRAWRVRSRDEIRACWESPSVAGDDGAFRDAPGCARASR